MIIHLVLEVNKNWHLVLFGQFEYAHHRGESLGRLNFSSPMPTAPFLSYDSNFCLDPSRSGISLQKKTNLMGKRSVILAAASVTDTCAARPLEYQIWVENIFK